MSPPGRPKDKYRNAQRESTPMNPAGPPERARTETRRAAVLA